MSGSNIGFLNILSDGSLPSVFNPSTFRSSVIQTDNITTQNINVSSQSTTNGIIDYDKIEANNLTIENQANFLGVVSPNSTCLATTNYVDTKINNVLGSNVPQVLDTLSEIASAINNDPSFSTTIVNRLITDETAIQTNANNLTTTNQNLSSLTNTVNSIQSQQVIDGVDISNIKSNLTTLQNSLSADEATIASHTSTLSSHTSSISTLTSGLSTANSNISSNTSSINTINNTTIPTLATKDSPVFTTSFQSPNITDSSGNVIINSNLTINALTTFTNDLSFSSNCDLVNGGSLNVSGQTSLNNVDISGTLNCSSMNLSGQSLSTTLSDLQSQITTNTGNITTNTGNIATNTSVIALKANDNAVVHLTGNETIGGIKIFSSTPLIGLNSVATTNDITTAINNLINSSPSTLDTLGEIATVLQNNVNDIGTITSSMVNLSGNQTISGIKTFSSSPIVPTVSQGDNSTKTASTEYVDTGLSTKLNTSSPSYTGTLSGVDLNISGNSTIGTSGTNTLTVKSTPTFQNGLSTNTLSLNGTDLNTRISAVESSASSNTSSISTLNSKTTGITYNSGTLTTNISGTLSTPSISLNSVDLQTTLNGKQSTLSYDSVPTSGSSNMCNSGVIYTALQSVSGGSGASLSYDNTFTGIQTFSNNCVFNGNNSVNGVNTYADVNEYNKELVISELVEKYNSPSVSSNALSITYGSQSNLYYITPSSANNIALTISSIPTVRQAVYDFTFIINTSSYKQYINSLTVNGSSITMKSVGGLSNISVNTSSAFVIQTINILMNNSTIVAVFTNVASMY